MYKAFEKYSSAISNPDHKEKLQEVFSWIENQYPELMGEFKWNQPMFTHHNTFILAFSTAKHHFSVAPEQAGMIHFTDQIKQAGYAQSKMLFKIKWTDDINYSLLKNIIDYNIKEKMDTTSFWR